MRHAEAMSERAKMLAGELYRASDPELTELRQQARSLVARYNATPPEADELRSSLLPSLLAEIGDDVEIEPPFHCDYGSNIRIGSQVYFNVGCVILDCANVRIGDNVKFGPGVHIYAATHPTDPALRRAALENSAPITIGDSVWIGGGSIILPGITIGENTTVGAGSVVTSDLPAGVIAAGNPCRVLRSVFPRVVQSG